MKVIVWQGIEIQAVIGLDVNWPHELSLPSRGDLISIPCGSAHEQFEVDSLVYHPEQGLEQQFVDIWLQGVFLPELMTLERFMEKYRPQWRIR